MQHPGGEGRDGGEGREEEEKRLKSHSLEEEQDRGEREGFLRQRNKWKGMGWGP